MNVLENLNRALEYIEQNLENEVYEHEIARRAYCSVYHFKRMFSYLAGISLQDYIRRRRLTLAALELQNSTVKVIDIAMKYGYHSPDAFTRAFQSQHGITPTEMRTTNQSLIVYPPMTFRLSIGGGEPMKLALNNMEPFGTLHVDVGGVGRGKGDYDYYFAVASTEPCPEKFSRLDIPKKTWVVINVKVPWGPEKWQQIYGEWFPSSGYEQVEGPTIQIGPEIQVGLEKQIITEEDEVEYWIPVKKVR